MNRPLKGINYDTGFAPYGPERTSRKLFDLGIVEQEMQVIAAELACSHIRITGADPERIADAARKAVTAGLSVWFSPFPCNLTADELLDYLVDCAKRAEEIRLISPDTVFVLGCELSLFNSGFLPGHHFLERTGAFAEFGRWKPAMIAQLQSFFTKAVPEIRTHFKGTITYAAGEWEKIDWSLFDIVSVDLYRASHNQAYYAQQLKNYCSHGKPVAITEFGCCPVTGAADLGGNATFTILSIKDGKLTVNEDWQYSEEEQVNYLRELFAAFIEAGVAYAFWFTFADYQKPYCAIAEQNLDMASYGIVQMKDDRLWEPRQAFLALRDLLRSNTD